MNCFKHSHTYVVFVQAGTQCSPTCTSVPFKDKYLILGGKYHPIIVEVGHHNTSRAFKHRGRHYIGNSKVNLGVVNVSQQSMGYLL